MSGSLFVVGTRPEAIKMAPVILAALERNPHGAKVCVTGQHREILDGVLALFGIEPDHDLEIMLPGQSLCDVTTAALHGVQKVIDKIKPQVVVVHGDTTTTLAGSLAAYYSRVPLAHVEAGLRTGNKQEPFPEEVNRKVAGVIADFHFAPTEEARSNLLREGIARDSIHVTGNTVVDALHRIVKVLDSGDERTWSLEKRFAFLNRKRRVVLVTAHRRENFGERLERICAALVHLVQQQPDIEVVFPVHPNPRVQEPVQRILGPHPGRIHLIQPLDYLAFVYLLRKAYLVITDSGGVQEEAPSLGKPVLVLRETTERPEAVAAGTVRLVGTDPDAIVAHATELLSDGAVYRKMSQAHNPYGDGQAAERIISILSTKLSL